MDPKEQQHVKATPALALLPPTASIIPHIALYVVQIFALLFHPSKGRNHVFSILITGLAVYAHLHPHFTNDPGVAQPFTIGWSYYMATLAKLLFSGPSGPEAKYWHADRPQAEALSYSAFGWQKLRWGPGLDRQPAWCSVEPPGEKCAAGASW